VCKQEDPILQSLASGWEPPINASRIEEVTFGGLNLPVKNGETWRHWEIENSATLTVSMVPYEVPERYGTIQRAIDEALEGGTVVIGEGVYEETLDITRSVNLVAETIGSTIIQQPSSASEGDNADAANAVVRVFTTADAEANGEPEVMFRGLSIMGAHGKSKRGSAEPAMGVELWRGKLFMDNCAVAGCGSHGVYVCGKQASVKLTGCVISDNQEDGLRVESQGKATCHSTDFHENGGNGVHAGGSGTMVSMRKCMFARNKTFCAVVESRGDIRFSKCVLATTQHKPCRTTSGGRVGIDENDCELWTDNFQPISSLKASIAERDAPPPAPNWYDVAGHLAAAGRDGGSEKRRPSTLEVADGAADGQVTMGDVFVRPSIINPRSEASADTAPGGDPTPARVAMALLRLAS